MSASTSYSVIYLDIFAGLSGLICRFFCVIASLFIASRIKKNSELTHSTTPASAKKLGLKQVHIPSLQ